MTPSPNASPYLRPAALAAGLCLVLFLAASLSRPLFPVDETRYLTVAWEMHQSGNWILPTLNFEPYHHKPPVLFWLINLMWGIFGVSQTAAMIVPYLAAFAFLMLTARLATRLFPAQKDAPLLSVALLAGSLPFVIYANLIMFDLLLGVFALIGITALWDYLRARNKQHLVLLSLAVGLGALTKGPVILLHIAPALLLAKFWMGPQNIPLKKVVLPITLSVLAGAAIALSWAIPAAIEGGKEFADKIFWGQTAGRMVKSFDHQRPIYWYLMFLPLFFLPWAASPSLWAGAKSFVKSGLPEDKRALKFLISWGVPVFVAFSLISGKQVHYLIPLLPCLALFLTAAALKAAETVTRKDIWPILLLTITLTLAPVVMYLGAATIETHLGGNYHLGDSFANTEPLPSIIAAIVIAGLGLFFIQSRARALSAIAIAMVLMISTFELASKNGFFTEYDLSPFAKEIEARPDRPVAFMNNYQGEFGFLAHRKEPIRQIKTGDLAKWFEDNPNGLAIFRSKKPEDFEKYKVLYTMPYRLTATYALVESPK